MGEDSKQKVGADAAEPERGAEAGLNSAEDTKNWKAGNELGRELREEGETKGPVYGSLNSKPPTMAEPSALSSHSSAADPPESECAVS